MIFLGLVFGLAGVGVTAQLSDDVVDNTNNNYETIASLQADAYGNELQRLEETARATADNNALRSDSVEEQETYLDNQRRAVEHDYLLSIDLVDDETGEIIASSEPPRTETTLSEQTPWLEDRLGDEESFVSEPYHDEPSDVPVFAAASQVPGADTTVVMSYRTEMATSLFDGAGLTEGSFVTVVNPDGQIVSHETRPELLLTQYGERSADLPFAGGSPENASGGTAVRADPVPGIIEQEHLAAYAPIEGTSWTLIVHSPATEAYGFSEQITTQMLYATGASVLLIGFVGVVLGKRTSQSINRLSEKAKRMEEGDLEVDLSSNRIDSIGDLYAGFASMRDALREQIREAEDAREQAEQERERVQEINEELLARADEYSTVMQTAADGDLTVRMDADADNEAMREIATEFNAMLDEIEATTERLKAFASDVAIASKQVTASSEEVRSASEQVTESIQEISDGAETQRDSLQTVNEVMADLSTSTQQIAASSSEVADIAEETAEVGDAAQTAAQSAIEGIHEIDEDSTDAVEAMNELEAEVEQVDELIERIGDIASQTNMLALNANIEASRSTSGDDTEGFSAVAEEVKDLSNQAKETAEQVEERLEAIRSRTRQSTEIVEQTNERIDDATEEVDEALSALEEIAQFAEDTNEGVQEISAATQQQSASTQEAVSMVNEAATISEQTTTEAENVAAAAEEQTTALTEVTRSASDLSDQATGLSEALEQFDTDASIEAADGIDVDVVDEVGDAADLVPEDEQIVGTLEDSGDDGDESTGSDEPTNAGSGVTDAPGGTDADADAETGTDADATAEEPESDAEATGDDTETDADGFEFVDSSDN